MNRVWCWRVILTLAWGAILVMPCAGVAQAQQGAAAGTAGSTASAAGEGQTNLAVSGRGMELHVPGTDIRQILKLLNTSRKVNIVATKEVVGSVTVDLYDVTFEEALDAVLKSVDCGYIRKGNFIYVYTQKQLEEIRKAGRPLAVRVFKLSYITATDAKTLIGPALSADGSISISPPAEVGIKTSDEETGGNTLAGEDVIVVCDYAENLEKVATILREVDVRPPQVLIEATILRATLDENNVLGIDFNVLAGLDWRTLGTSSTGLTNVSPGDLPTGEFDNANAVFRTDLNAGIDPGGLTIGVITNQAAFFVRALEKVTDVAVLANPKLLVVNKQRGEVLVGNRDGYLTTTLTTTEATQTVEFLETGTKLVVRPYVAGDGYIRLEVHPEDSTGGVTADQLPYEQTTECTSNVMVKDGHTIVIGGLFREHTSNGRTQLPYLGNVPVVGNLFRRRSEETKREEVIILITPHVIKHPIDEVVSEQYKDQVERIRLGLRQELMWFGRDRLAQAHMRWARQHLGRGDRDKALWDVTLALSLEPRMQEAIRLKEQLTNEAIWAHEARYSSVAHLIQRMIMQELGEPAEKAVPPAKPRNGMRLDEKIRGALGIGRLLELPLRSPAGTETPAAKQPPAPGATTKPAQGSQ